MREYLSLTALHTRKRICVANASCPSSVANTLRHLRADSLSVTLQRRLAMRQQSQACESAGL